MHSTRYATRLRLCNCQHHTLHFCCLHISVVHYMLKYYNFVVHFLLDNLFASYTHSQAPNHLLQLLPSVNWYCRCSCFHKQLASLTLTIFPFFDLCLPYFTHHIYHNYDTVFVVRRLCFISNFVPHENIT